MSNLKSEISQSFRTHFRARGMTASRFDKVKLAYAEMKTTGAGFIVFEHGGQWFEVSHNRYRIKRICGARKKTGERCRSKDLHRGGKCKFHGGLSTGARTPAGKAKAIAAMRAGHAKWLSERFAQGRGRVKTAMCK